jgi:hypothetical protein
MSANKVNPFQPLIPRTQHTQQELEAMLEQRVEGSMELRKAYKVVRGGKPFIIPVEWLTAKEVADLIAEQKAILAATLQELERLRAEDELLDVALHQVADGEATLQ